MKYIKVYMPIIMKNKIKHLTLKHLNTIFLNILMKITNGSLLRKIYAI